MKIANYLSQNLRWELNKNPFENYVCLPTNLMQTKFVLEKIADKYYNTLAHINVLQTEFCLNNLALSRPKTASQRFAMKHYDEFWAKFIRLKLTFGKDYLVFPSNGETTRLEQIAELITKCTQFALTNGQMQELVAFACQTLDLNEREQRNLINVIELYKIKYYCAVATQTFGKGKRNVANLAKLFDESLLKVDYTANYLYRQSPYASDKLLVALDCLGNSVAKFDNFATQIEQRLSVNCNGRNVFDTFCQSKFGLKTAEFTSTGSCEIAMRYFVDGAREIRRYRITNNGKQRKNYNIVCTFEHTNPANKVARFGTDNALCIAVSGQANFYCATAFVHENTIIQSNADNCLAVNAEVLPNKCYEFEVVTIYANDTPNLTLETENLYNYGSTRCPFVDDELSPDITEGQKIIVTPHGYSATEIPAKPTALNFTYQLGNCDVATFVDNVGRSATLINGFAFTTAGEKLYGIANGFVNKINGNNFVIDGDNLTYDNGKSKCVITHFNNGKKYEISHLSPCKTLLYFPFERQAQISYDNGTFAVSDGIRNYFVKCSNVESYTTDAIECNSNRLRYKLSGNLQCGNCLAVCLSQSQCATVEVVTAHITPKPQPMIRESLISTYLNYVNEKAVFCLNNMLKRADPLSLSAICYTNPCYVKNYIVAQLDDTNKPCCYYDGNGKLQHYSNPLTFALATVYYCNLVGEVSEDAKRKALEIILGEYTGQNLCYQALALKKAINIDGVDKVAISLRYNKAKSAIEHDSKLFAYAQAIGAVPMINPSKERLKDLCKQFDICKSWYYVSQLENLYGLTISPQKLFLAPKISSENVLEQLALTVAGKRFDTTFTKATVQSMVLNGTQYFQPFCPQSVKTENNTLVVSY